MTVVIVEHDVEALAELADRIVALDDGTVALDGSPSAVFGEVAALHRVGLRAPQVQSWPRCSATCTGRSRSPSTRPCLAGGAAVTRGGVRSAPSRRRTAAVRRPSSTA